jgi:hypothetical protein
MRLMDSYLRKSLESLTMTVRQLVVWMDREMQGPSNDQRGAKISKLMNALEFVNDSVRHFTLGENLKRPKKIKPIPAEATP